jgi:hypothetical protein
MPEAGLLPGFVLFSDREIIGQSSRAQVGIQSSAVFALETLGMGTLGTLGNLIFTKTISENQLDAIVMI